MTLRRELVGFAVGGVLGFIVDASIVQSLVRLVGWHPYPARAVSFTVAATFTWWWSRKVTFAHRQSAHAAHAEWIRWVALMLGGAVLNLGTFVVALKLFPALREWPAIATAAGAAAGAGCNFVMARLALFKAPAGSR